MMKRRCAQRGSTMIEFALSAFLLFTFFSGVFQLGYTFYAYNTLVNAVRDGARYASLKPVDLGSAPAGGDFLRAVQNQVVYGSPAPPPGAPPVLNGLTTGNVSLIVAPKSVTVSITDFHINAVFSTLALNGRPSAAYPYTGTVVTAEAR